MWGASFHTRRISTIFEKDMSKYMGKLISLDCQALSVGSVSVDLDLFGACIPKESDSDVSLTQQLFL